MRFANRHSIGTAAATLMLVVGCGGSGTSDEAPEVPKKFQIYPPELYSGFDGTNTYKVPLQIFKNSGPITFTIDDMSLVSMQSNADNTKITLTTLKGGSTMLHATAGGMTVSAPLSIAMYTPAQNAAGKARYTSAPDKDNPGCQECHGAGKGPDHTPSEVDADPDDAILNTFLTGKDPEGRPVGEEFVEILKGKKHMWKVTKEEEMGLVSYLRSLTPTGYPEYDTATAGE